MDFACASIGAVSVPIYETDSQKQADSIITEVQPAIAFGGDENHTILGRIAEQVNASATYHFENGAFWKSAHRFYGAKSGERGTSFDAGPFGPGCVPDDPAHPSCFTFPGFPTG